MGEESACKGLSRLGLLSREKSAKGDNDRLKKPEWVEREGSVISSFSTS